MTLKVETWSHKFLCWVRQDIAPFKCCTDFYRWKDWICDGIFIPYVNEDFPTQGHSRKSVNIDLLIRPMSESDISKLVRRYSFPWSTPEKTKMLWDTYYQEQQKGIRTVAVLEEEDEILGYGSLLRKPECPFFSSSNIPEVNAVWIDEDHRRQGLGTALIQWLEGLAIQEGYDQPSNCILNWVTAPMETGSRIGESLLLLANPIHWTTTSFYGYENP